MGYGNKTYHGSFTPENREKYVGNIKKITYRSSWELQFMRYCDINDDVVRWGSETFKIPYRIKGENKSHTYYMDFWVQFKTGDKYLFEIKPYAETLPPVPPKTNSKKSMETYLHQLRTYKVNTNKWFAAMEAARVKGLTFRILTERSLPRFGVNCNLKQSGVQKYKSK